MLTSQQKAYFETFGFIVRRQLFSPEEMAAIADEFEDVLNEDRHNKPFEGKTRHAVSAFVEKRPLLRQLVEDDRIYEPIRQLLGPDFIWQASDGNLYVGDTAWHRDAGDLELNFTRIKVAVYLDPVGRETGCLRVIPGSHRAPLHDDLRPLNYWRKKQVILEGRSTQADLDQFVKEMNISEDEPLFGVDPREVPAVPLESRPGDVVFFNQHLYHSAFGGATGRRMFTMNFAVNPTTDEQVALLRKHHEISSRNRPVMQHTVSDRIYDEAFFHSDRPRIQGMMAKLIELGFE
jgi:hypothetical protein